MIRYKLTDENMQTYGGFQWKLGKVYEIDIDLQNKNMPLCFSSWFHVYSHPLVAVLMNPIHAKFTNPRLFKCSCSGYHQTDTGLKEGFTKVKLLKELKIPEITLTQRVAFGILCAKKVYKEKEWNEWADKWLKGKDRSWDVAYDVYFATNAACSATNAACSATGAACSAAGVAYSGTYAVYCATNAACSVAGAAWSATHYNNNINLIALAKRALKY